MRIFKMLTLSDINAATNSKDGDIYSDLYKDVYGSRPRYARFESVQDFDRDFNRLSKMLDEQIDEEAEQQLVNFAYFETYVEEVQKIMNGCTREDAIRSIADSEGISKQDFDFYGLEILEYSFDLKYGSIARWLSK